MEDKLATFETIDKIVNYSSSFGCNDIKYPFAYSEKKHLLHASSKKVDF